MLASSVRLEILCPKIPVMRKNTIALASLLIRRMDKQINVSEKKMHRLRGLET